MTRNANYLFYLGLIFGAWLPAASPPPRAPVARRPCAHDFRELNVNATVKADEYKQTQTREWLHYSDYFTDKKHPEDSIDNHVASLMPGDITIEAGPKTTKFQTR